MYGYAADTMKLAGWIAVAVLAALLGRQLFPRTETVTEFITLPSQTDTVTVSKLDSIEVVRFRDRVVFEDRVIIDTVWRTRPDTLDTLPLTWYLTRLQVGHRLDTGTYVSGEGLAYDGALTRVQTFEQYPVTFGPVTDIRTDSLGIHVRFGEWPVEDKGCQFGCILQWSLGSLAAGVVIGSLF